jgi:hypothetical protein
MGQSRHGMGPAARHQGPGAPNRQEERDRGRGGPLRPGPPVCSVRWLRGTAEELTSALRSLAVSTGVAECRAAVCVSRARPDRPPSLVKRVFLPGRLSSPVPGWRDLAAHDSGEQRSGMRRAVPARFPRDSGRAGAGIPGRHPAIRRHCGVTGSLELCGPGVALTGSAAAIDEAEQMFPAARQALTRNWPVGSLRSPTTYRQNAARTAAAVEL